MANHMLILFCVLHVSTTAILGCVNMWDAADSLAPADICPVKTSSGKDCVFPFTYNGDSYTRCTIGGPSNPSRLPQCITTDNTWSFCQVPTDAVITSVTTRKGGSSWYNGASSNGETLVWVTGLRFAPNVFSFSPSTTTSNRIVLESSTSSFDCDLHVDKCTTTQLTCWTKSGLVQGVTYLVRVYVNDKIIPLYQYVRPSDADVAVTADATPSINQITPYAGIPGSFVNIYGDFNTACYGRDIDTCADDSGARISRVYFGAQLCDLVDQSTSHLYAELNATALKCKLKGSTVGIFNASMIVSEDNGRSIAKSSTYYVTPGQLIYNFQSYAEITSVTPNAGSTQGSTKVTITGKYLYHSDYVPASVTVAGSTCKVVSFDNTDEENAKIVCETASTPASQTDYLGNRGINVVRDNVLTSFATLATASPSGSATSSWSDAASFVDTNTVDVTVWLTGFLTPEITSDYLFSLTTNGAAKLYLSTDATSANKQEVASNDPSTSTNATLTKNLQAGQVYYLQAVASKSAGELKLEINAKLYGSNLNGKVSDMIKTEVQDIEITSTIVPEQTTITYAGLTPSATGTPEVQTLTIESSNSDNFVLSFDGAKTATLPFGASATAVQSALNDLPTLVAEGVTVTRTANAISGWDYTITFTANRGDVPAITETKLLVTSTNTETTKGVPTQAQMQFNVQNAWSNLFNVATDSTATMRDAIEEIFRIRCPQSIQKAIISQGILAVSDFENECTYDEQELSLTAFCGKCARKNSGALFWNIQTSLTYNQLCFAYKLASPITSIGFWLLIDNLIKKDAYLSVTTIADNEWHYQCFDMHQAVLNSWNTDAATYPKTRLTLTHSWVYPVVEDMYIDVASIRNAVPKDIDDASLIQRRVFPALQIVDKSLTVTRDSVNSVITVSYRPNNCTVGLNPSTVRQAIASLPSVASVSSASGPVQGTFDLLWNSQPLNGVSVGVTAKDFRSLLQSVSGMGQVGVTRTKDCAGYKWRIEWVYGGNQPAISIPSNTLAGNTPAISATPVTDGGIEYYPVQGDMVRTSHSKAQFSVNINGIPSKCSTNCAFEWLGSLTPVVNTITTSGTTVSIAGTGFDATTLSNNVVTIGDTPCTVTAATATSITCTAGQGPVGTFGFKVYVLPKGLATMSSPTQFTFALTATSRSPATSGTGGGVLLTIAGTGFSKLTTVTVDGNNCPVKTFTYTSITCTVPSNPTTSNKLANIQVVDGSSSVTLTDKLTYDYINSAVVTSITPSSSLDVAGGQTITIVGTNFNTAITQVYFGTEPAKIRSFTSTQIVVTSPALKPGAYDVVIPQGTLGNAWTPNSVSYVLYVSSFTPRSGSIRGGTVVVVYGDGFNTDCTLNKVRFGESDCKVLDCSTKWIKCQTTNGYKVYNVDNTGTDLKYGKGFAWSQSYLNINQGEYVSWKWSPPATISDTTFVVEQVANPTSTTLSGFSSGSPSSSGSFTYQFNTVGTYYYWSGYVDSSATIAFRGVIIVGPAADRELTVVVTVNGFKAEQQSSSITSSPAAATCPGSNVNLGSCSLSNPTSSYDYRFTTCTVATVSSVSASSGSVGDSITIVGTGFSTTACENLVWIGDYSCPITSSSATQIVCTIGSNSNLVPGVKYRIEVQIKNSGNAIQNDWYTFNFVPKILSITPQIGSSAGGTIVTVTGDGFVVDATGVGVGGVSFTKNNANIIYGQVILTTHSSVGSGTLDIYVNGVQAACGASPNCNYEFSSSVAPTLASITPSSVSDATVLTLTGTQFGTDATKLSVKIGDSATCTISAATDTSITCSLTGLAVGVQSVVVNRNGVGNAIQATAVTVTGVAAVKALSPSSGSVYGGTVLTITGNGFDTALNTAVKLGTKTCTISSVSSTQIVCLTPDNLAGASTVTVTSNGITFPTSTFTYSAALSPSVTSVAPTSGTGGDLVTITGTGFGTVTGNVNVKIGTAACVVQTVSSTQITCTAGSNAAGTFGVQVQISPNGYSNSNIQFTYNLAVSSMSAVEGSYGGGLEVTLTGSGFAGSSTSITVCGTAAVISGSTGATQVIFKVPSKTSAATDIPCPVVVTVNGATQSRTFTYKASLTPTLSSVSPLRAGTGGGTLLTIAGTQLTTDPTKVTVTIAGTNCVVLSASLTAITCTTGAYSSSSIKAPVLVFIQGSGLAYTSTPVEFTYIDLWSSKFTWGGFTTPEEGDLIVVGPGQTIYLDIVTPILKGLIIQGGALIFDDNQDVGLRAEYIVIADNGLLQVGTEANPFQHRATITMYGSLRSVELPIFGSKVLALRNGTLDLHGAPVGATWTYLGATAAAASTTITLLESVSWPVGGKIIIATTGDKLSQGESEMRTITAKSADGKTLTLDQPLAFEHLSVKRTNAGVDVYIRAEVGLLSRNVVFNAINDDSWNALRSAEACPAGFNPGEFATMTCFLGRYGAEIGSDEFGATIMINAAQPNQIGKESVIARISNVELFHVGQAFRLGRYPIHFHMIGDSPSSYVRECAIRESFNRAVNIHATNYVTVERTVIYNIMGGAFFLEDGIEIGNTFQYNLAVFVKTSSSLLNEDVTPAGFWATNPNNTWQHNAVAGGTHFGYWFRILDNPDGPSFTPNYCPKKIPMGKFLNNSVHSTGRFGLWIFPGYTPTVSGRCNDRTGSPAKFDGLVTYGCDKGAEFVMASNIQFRNFVSYDHESASIEGKTIRFHEDVNTDYASNFFDEAVGPLISDSIVIGNSIPGSTVSKTAKGVVIAWDRGLLVKNVKFINFPDANSFAIGATEITGRCSFGCGGWTTHFSGLSFSNVRFKTLHRWSWDAVMRDLDGSLSGAAGNVVVSATNITAADSRCSATNTAFSGGAVCSSTTDWIRFSFNNNKPDAPVFLDVKNTQGAIDVSPMLKKRLTHKFGYMVALEANQVYAMNFEQASFPTNLSYTGSFYGLKSNQYIIVKHEMNKKPDQVNIFSNVLAKEANAPLSIDANGVGEWYWDNSTREMSYILHNKQAKTPFIDFKVSFNAKKCRYANCQAPTQPSVKIPATKRPATTIFYWSKSDLWALAGVSITRAAPGTPSSYLPVNGDAVTIPADTWVVVDIPLPALRRLRLDGTIEIEDTQDNTLTVGELFINGGQFIVGFEDAPFTHNFEIILTGDKLSAELKLPNGFDTMGAKAIGVYGALDLHGKPRTPSWTQLASTASAGSNQITLKDAVDWLVDEEIVVSTTSTSAFDTETFKITEVSADKKTLKLNATLKANHLVASETFANGKSYSVAAAVGLLTRNVKVTGGEYASQFNDLFGSRIIVSDYSDFVYAEGSTIPLTIYYKGNARIENVQFRNFGQYSRESEDDYKYGVLFSNLGAYDPLRKTYLKNCAFHNGFASAVGLRNTIAIPVLNNVIHRSLDSAFRVEGHSNIFRNNLITMTLWGPTFVQYEAPFELEYWGVVDIRKADSIVFEDNLIAGAERIGLRYRGSPCVGQSLPTAGANHSISGNSFYGTLIGATIFPKDGFPIPCIRVSNFFVYKSVYTGLYYQETANVVFDSNILVDNKLAIFPQVFSPSAISHTFVARSINIENNLIIGTSPSFDCAKDIEPLTFNTRQSGKAKIYGAGADEKGRIGVVWANFLSGTNTAPFKPFYIVMNYNYINGLSTLDGNTFAYFNSRCGSTDAVITTSKLNDDGQMPVLIKNTVFYNVDANSKVFLHRPNIDKINPSDCVDMDCDGLKKNLLTDADGTFLGSPGTVISQSEFEWGLQSRGIGDYRVPKQVLADGNGNQLPPSSVYTYQGIVRDENKCAYKGAWQAYECHGLDYRMLVIESMDKDTEDRRLSPVAILSDNKYIDLINGPQDHGWCFGYTCQKRISTFLALVVAGKHYDIFTSSTPPNHLRFRIINADSTFKIRLSMSYSTSNNINVYKGINLVDPTNADRSSGSLILKDPAGSNTFMPQITDPAGTNFFSRTQQKAYFSIDGSDPIDLIISPDIFLKFGVSATTANSFFNSANLVANVATLLGVPASKIKRVEIVSETGSTSRLAKRSTQVTAIQVTLYSDPPSTSTGTQAAYDASLLTTGSITNNFYFGYTQAQATSLGLTLTSLSVTVDGTTTEVKEIGSISLITDVSKCRAQSPCETQPVLQLLDKNGATLPVVQYGNALSVDVTVTQGTNSVINQAKAYFDANGKTQFTILGFDQEGTNFIVQYTLSAGVSVVIPSIFKASSSAFAVTAPTFTLVQVESEVKAVVSKSFSASFYLADSVSLREMPNPGYKGQIFTACVSLYQTGNWQRTSATLVSSPSNCVTLSAPNRLELSNVTIDTTGAYGLQLAVTSNNIANAAVSLTQLSNLIRVFGTAAAQSNTVETNTHFSYDGTFDKSNCLSYITQTYNCFLKNYALELVNTITCYSGSLKISSTIDTTNTVALANLSSTRLTLFDPEYIVKGAQLNSFDYATGIISHTKTVATTESKVVNIGGIVGGTMAGLAAVALIAVGSVLIYRQQKLKKQNSGRNGTKLNSGKRLLNDAQHDKFVNESVTVTRPTSVLKMSRIQDVRTPEGLFTARETTMSAIQVENN